MVAAAPHSRGCDKRRLVIAHFEEGLDSGSERELRTHLERCDDCRRAYEGELLIERLDPKGSTPKARLGRALGIGPRRSRKRRVVAAAAAAAVLLAVGLARHLDHAQPTGFQARGGTDSRPAPTLKVYHGHHGRKLHPARHALPKDGELAFAYSNPGDRPYLLVFGVDDAQRIYWYHPGWTDAAKNPRAITIEKGVALRELPSAIRHDYGGKKLTVVGLFSTRRLTVRQVEKTLRAAGFDPTRAFSAKDYDLVLKRYALQPTPRKEP